MDEWFTSQYPITTNKLDYRLPEGLFSVSEVRVFNDEDSQTYYNEDRYDVVDEYLRFRIPMNQVSLSPTEQNLTNDRFNSGTFPMHNPLQLIGRKIPDILTSDTATTDLDDKVEELLILQSAQYLLDKRLAMRTKFDRYSAQVNKTDMSVLDQIRMKNTFQGRIVELSMQLEEIGKPTNIDFGG